MAKNWQRIRLVAAGSAEWQKITSTIIRDGNNRGYCYSSLIVSVITIFLIRFAGE